jgi:hypothetical protein
MPTKSPKMYIDGKWVESSSGRREVRRSRLSPHRRHRRQDGHAPVSGTDFRPGGPRSWS